MSKIEYWRVIGRTQEHFFMHLENAIERAKELALGYEMEPPYEAKAGFNRQEEYHLPKGQCYDFVYGEAEVFVQPMNYST